MAAAVAEDHLALVGQSSIHLVEVGRQFDFLLLQQI
jgi:hypothetical protein